MSRTRLRMAWHGSGPVITWVQLVIREQEQEGLKREREHGKRS